MNPRQIRVGELLALAGAGCVIASLFLLLLAGANVANIQLAQAMNRRKTILIEASLDLDRRA